MMALPPKICPRCREEYVHQASVCVHCDVPLVLAEGLPETPAEALPPADELACIRTASVGWVRGLSDLLREGGVAHRIEPLAPARPGAPPAFGVFVRPEDLEEARALDADHARSEVPDLPEGFEAVAPGEEVADGADACPACGEPLAAEAVECGGCGLFLGPGE